jgi:hypothetical protein
MSDNTDKQYDLYDLSEQTGIVRKKSIDEKNSHTTISFYDASVNSNNGESDE